MKRLKRFKLLKRGFWVLLGLAIAGYLGLFWWSHRPLPQIDGQMTAPGLTFPATVIRDEGGVAHIEAANEADGYYALGWTAAQDRLFQIELWRHVAQGRLAEMFGPDVVKFDKLFRTMDFHGGGRRMLAEATPTALKAFAAYTRGVNDYAAARPLPVEFALLGLGWEPLKPQDLTGMVGYMAWSLHYGWNFDPLVESLSVRLGPQKTAELFPSALGEGRGTTQNSRQGGNSLAANNPAPRNAIHAVQTLALKDEAPASHVLPGLFHLTPRERDWQDLLPTLAGSNTWVISPAKSATGQALLANDPHLAHSQPGIWYLAHLKAGDFEAVGTTIAGTPLFVMGHNRRIGWGVTAMMADGGDFFLEKTRPGQGPPQGQGGQPNRLEVMYKGQWVQTTSRREEIKIKGEDSIFMEITTTPHGPLVNHLLDHEPRPVAYQWVYQKTDKTNDLEAVFQLNRAKNWAGFRKAVSGFGGLCLNISYADADGNIGIQTVGSIPRIKGTGTRYRTGWDGSQEWNG
ncbi:MAG: penicillin acylase family protein, partial [Deltaproteobacteria bacterium]|nr:penicillin acylase family protein [Deltaproteobacteria bacterium]